MSDVVQETTNVVKEAEQYVETFFALEKTHLQNFLNYLSAKPYHEVVNLIEGMKTAKVVVLNPTIPTSPAVVDPSSLAANVTSGDTTNS